MIPRKIAKGSRITFSRDDGSPAFGEAQADYGAFVAIAVDGDESTKTIPKLIGRERIQEAIAAPKERALTRGKHVGGEGNLGQFARRDFDKMCTCGHRFGSHTAARPHECMGADGFGVCELGCKKFRAARSPRR